ncbi:MAG: glycosyltransferase family 4 protein [Roseibium sp.]|uniref:glycosyltransferase family 4 protein n=1 Tax=Roseibium sp. TaxID=1936156 RepID=UPI003D9C6716
MTAQYLTSQHITFFPDYRATNPYQTLLYEALEPAFRAEPGSITDALERQALASDGPNLFHLHWEHAVLVGAGTPTSVEEFLNDLGRFRETGGKVVWTIHNLAPHDTQKNTANEDLQTGLCELADILHLHSLHALTAARAEMALPEKKTRIIAHHNYEGAYPVYARNSARDDLNLSAARRIVLSPGRIAPYKQPEELAEAFLAFAHPDDRLIFAGEVARNYDLKLPDDARLLFREGFATQEDVGRLHAAADFVVLPYRASLTSGSAILAATLARAVLGPDSPGLRDVIDPPKSGLIYEDGALAEALKSALDEDPGTWTDRGRHAAASAASRDRKMLAATWQDVLSSLTKSPFGRLGAE